MASLSLPETGAIDVEPKFTLTRQKTEYLSNRVRYTAFLHKLNVASQLCLQLMWSRSFPLLDSYHWIFISIAANPIKVPICNLSWLNPPPPLEFRHNCLTARLYSFVFLIGWEKCRNLVYSSMTTHIDRPRAEHFPLLIEASALNKVPPLHSLEGFHFFK